VADHEGRPLRIEPEQDVGGAVEPVTDVEVVLAGAVEDLPDQDALGGVRVLAQCDIDDQIEGRLVAGDAPTGQAGRPQPAEHAEAVLAPVEVGAVDDPDAIAFPAEELRHGGRGRRQGHHAPLRGGADDRRGVSRLEAPVLLVEGLVGRPQGWRLRHLVRLVGAMDRAPRAGDDLEHQPGDGGDGELLIALAGRGVAKELGERAGVEGPGQESLDQDGQGADFHGGLELLAIAERQRNATERRGLGPAGRSCCHAYTRMLKEWWLVHQCVEQAHMSTGGLPTSATLHRPP
jgi:hypothetical protein